MQVHHNQASSFADIPGDVSSRSHGERTPHGEAEVGFIGFHEGSVEFVIRKVFSKVDDRVVERSIAFLALPGSFMLVNFVTLSGPEISQKLALAFFAFLQAAVPMELC